MQSTTENRGSVESPSLHFFYLYLSSFIVTLINHRPISIRSVPISETRGSGLTFQTRTPLGKSFWGDYINCVTCHTFGESDWIFLTATYLSLSWNIFFSISPGIFYIGSLTLFFLIKFAPPSWKPWNALRMGFSVTYRYTLASWNRTAVNRGCMLWSLSLKIGATASYQDSILWPGMSGTSLHSFHF